MRIIQVVHSFPPRYEGIGNYCFQLSGFLAQKGHQVDVLTSRLYSDSPIQEFRDGFTIHRCPYFGAIGTNRMTFVVDKLLRANVDVVHAHSHIFLTSNQAALAKRLKDFPFLLHLHGGLDAVPPKCNMLTRLQYTAIKDLYDRTIGKWTLNSADLIASVSKRDIMLSKELFGLAENHFCWVPNAVDVNAFGGSGSFDSSDKTKFVLFVGSLVTRKGIDIILTIAKRFARERPDVCFVLIGDGPLKNWLKHVSESLHLNVKILGRVERPELVQWLSKASVFLLPSYSEGLPTVCLEALASRLPVVASNVGGIPEVVIDGKTGYLVSPGNSQECVDKLLILLSDENIRKTMGDCGRNLITQFYSWERVMPKIEKIYESLVIC